MKLKEYIQNKSADFDNKKMSSEADIDFAQRLQKELHTPVNGNVIYLKYLAIAASFALLISIGFWTVNGIKTEKEKTNLVANLMNESAGTRLEGIYHFEDEFKKEDEQIIEVLIEILYNDGNANVKIATLDALLNYPNNEQIRMSLIKALETEKTPLVQIKLIKSLSILRENRAQKPLEKLIEDKETLPIVVNNASLAMLEISQTELNN